MCSLMLRQRCRPLALCDGMVNDGCAYIEFKFMGSNHYAPLIECQVVQSSGQSCIEPKPLQGSHKAEMYSCGPIKAITLL